MDEGTVTEKEAQACILAVHQFVHNEDLDYLLGTYAGEDYEYVPEMCSDLADYYGFGFRFEQGGPAACWPIYKAPLYDEAHKLLGLAASLTDGAARRDKSIRELMAAQDWPTAIEAIREFCDAHGYSLRQAAAE